MAGASTEHAYEMFVQVLSARGGKDAAVVMSEDGMDEVSPFGGHEDNLHGPPQGGDHAPRTPFGHRLQAQGGGVHREGP
ncbi:hypothetical protein [Thermogymnomonas acidicola]|uniref:hypothetical protein n=1 Tax=Thermogymnomonas acidicola TaxID=399579 RepID=UPI001494058D|nr:hypothetical protein [Thermogymnomonas acidicola]